MDIHVATICLGLFGTIALATNRRNKMLVLGIVLPVSLFAITTVAVVTLGTMAFQFCDEFKHMCGISETYLNTFKIPVDNNSLMTFIFISGSGLGAVGIYVFLLTINPDKKEYPWLTVLGVVAIMASAVLALIQYVLP